MPPRQLLEIPWPMRGLVENTAYQRQAEGTTLDALNVRPFDQFEERLRGGQRTGLTKFVDTQLGNGSPVQFLSQITEAVPVIQDAGFGDKLADPTQAGLTESDDFFRFRWSPDGTKLVYQCSVLSTTDRHIAVWGWDGSSWEGPYHLDSSAANTTFYGPPDWSSDGQYLIAPLDAGTSTDSQIEVYEFVSGTGLSLVSTKVIPGETAVWSVAATPDGTKVFVASTDTMYCYEWTGNSLGGLLDSVTPSITATSYVNVSPSGDTVVRTNTSTSSSLQFIEAWPITPTGFGSAYSLLDTDRAIGDVYFAKNESLVVTQQNSRAYEFDKVTGFGNAVILTPDIPFPSNVVYPLQETPDGAFILGHRPDPDEIGLYKNTWPSRPTASDFVGSVAYDVVPFEFNNPGAFAIRPQGDVVAVMDDGPNGSIQAWRFDPAGTNPSGRDVRLVAVAGGDVYRSNTELTTIATVANGDDAFSADRPVRGGVAFQNLFLVDGESANYQYLDFSDATLKDWSSDLTAGSLPVGSSDTSLGCKIIAVYRGRVVLSGLIEDPQNWFMSKSGDPFDFDYSQSGRVAAVAGNNAEAGKLGDIITALAPYQDDVLIMGGQNTLWVMRGDPAAGGQIDNVSRQIGIAQDMAWTFDRFGNFYFFGNEGVYRMSPTGGMPESLSSGRLDKTFGDVDIRDNLIQLVYDREWRGVHLFISPFTEPDDPGSHYFWDERTDSWWRDEYPTRVGPYSLALFEADRPEDRAVLLGGYDGYIRRFDLSAKDDDGDAISSRIRFSPINLGGVFGSNRIHDGVFVLGEGSDNVQMDWFVGDTPEAADAAADAGTDPRVSRALIAGRNPAIRQRVAQNTVIPVMRQAAMGESWAYEHGGVTVEMLGRMHFKRV